MGNKLFYYTTNYAWQRSLFKNKVEGELQDKPIYVYLFQILMHRLRSYEVNRSPFRGVEQDSGLRAQP